MENVTRVRLTVLGTKNIFNGKVIDHVTKQGVKESLTRMAKTSTLLFYMYQKAGK